MTTRSTREIISNNIKFLRKEKNYTQDDLCRKLKNMGMNNISRSKISHWEFGDRNILINDLLTLCNYFQIDITIFSSIMINHNNYQELINTSRSINLILNNFK